MKNFFFAALATVAVLFASCEKIEPTAVNPESLTAAAKVTGFVQYQYATKSDTKVDVLPSLDVTVLRGTLVDGKMNYAAYKTTTDGQGFYQIDLPAAPGRTIDEVKVQARYEAETFYMHQDGKTASGPAIFSAQKSMTNVAAGIVTNIDLVLTPSAYTEEPAAAY